jgi:hypothetical protein
MPRLFQHFLSPSQSAPQGATTWVPPVPADDDLALGLECAHPVLQIERWLPDTTPQESSALN